MAVRVRRGIWLVATILLLAGGAWLMSDGERMPPREELKVSAPPRTSPTDQNRLAKRRRPPAFVVPPSPAAPAASQPEPEQHDPLLVAMPAQVIEANAQRAASELGLSPAERERFVAVVVASQAERRRLLDQERSGEKTPREILVETEMLSDTTEMALREILGDERLQRYLALRAAESGRGSGFVGAGAPPRPPTP